MFPNISPTQTKAWKKLQEQQLQMKSIQVKGLFNNDARRFDKYSLVFGDILFDYSKNLLNEETMQLLLELAQESQVAEAIQAMFAGEKINRTEDRSVLHTALRNLSGDPVYSDGKDVMPEVREVLAHMKAFCEKIHSGEWTGYSG
jgi:glucose-6-phosphate isomerase